MRPRVWGLSAVLMLGCAALAQQASTQQPATQKNESSTRVAVPRPAQTKPALPAALSTVFQKARPASIQISDCPPAAADPTCEDANGYGSGVLISADGQVLTAYHVVYGATRLVATTLDKKQYPLSVIGFDDQHDLALLKINVSGAPFVTLAQQGPKVGQAAVAIGNSGDKFLQPKAGKLLALNADAGQANFPPGTLEMDAPLAPGDSGGPVLNDAGQLIGITSYIQLEPSDKTRALDPNATTSAFLDSLKTTSYAVPVTSGSELLAQLRAGVKREAPVVGIGADGLPESGLPASILKNLGLGNRAGFVFTSLTSGGPAEAAGLHPLKATKLDASGTPVKATGDVITAVDGQAVKDYLSFLAAVRSHQVGDKVTLTVYRDGASKPLSIPVTLAPRTIAANGSR